MQIGQGVKKPGSLKKTGFSAPPYTDLIVFFHFQLPLITQLVEAEPALLIQRPPQVIRPRPPALADPIGGGSNVGRAIPVVGGTPSSKALPKRLMRRSVPLARKVAFWARCSSSAGGRQVPSAVLRNTQAASQPAGGAACPAPVSIARTGQRCGRQAPRAVPSFGNHPSSNPDCSNFNVRLFSLIVRTVLSSKPSGRLALISSVTSTLQPI